MEFNGIRNDEFIVDVNGRQKSPFHPRINDIERFRLKRSEMDLLEITQPISIKAFSHREKMEKIRLLGDWLIHKDWKSLSFDDEPGRYYLAIFEGMDEFVREGNSILWKGSLRFTAKATLGESHTYTLTPEFQKFIIAGQTETPWKSKTTFSEATDQYILESNTGLKILLNYDFIAGDVLEIDSEKRAIFLNGKDLRTSVSLSSDWNKGVIDAGFVELKASENTEFIYTERFY